MFWKFFSENPDFSMMRLVVFACLVSSISIAATSIMLNRDYFNLIALFLGSAIGGKVGQKAMEK